MGKGGGTQVTQSEIPGELKPLYRSTAQNWMIGQSAMPLVGPSAYWTAQGRGMHGASANPNYYSQVAGMNYPDEAIQYGNQNPIPTPPDAYNYGTVGEPGPPPPYQGGDAGGTWGGDGGGGGGGGGGNPNPPQQPGYPEQPPPGGPAPDNLYYDPVNNPGGWTQGGQGQGSPPPANMNTGGGGGGGGGGMNQQSFEEYFQQNWENPFPPGHPARRAARNKAYNQMAQAQGFNPESNQWPDGSTHHTGREGEGLPYSIPGQSGGSGGSSSGGGNPPPAPVTTPPSGGTGQQWNQGGGGAQDGGQQQGGGGTNYWSQLPESTRNIIEQTSSALGSK